MSGSATPDTIRDPKLRHLAELGHAQGWRIEHTTGGKIGWYAPTVSGGRAMSTPIFTPARLIKAGSAGHEIPNIVSQLRRAGLRLRPEDVEQVIPDPEPAVDPEPPERFVRELAGLIEQELERRTKALQEQVQALQNESSDLRQRLAESESDVEERARQAAARAVEEMLAARRINR